MAEANLALNGENVYIQRMEEFRNLQFFVLRIFTFPETASNLLSRGNGSDDIALVKKRIPSQNDRQTTDHRF